MRMLQFILIVLLAQDINANFGYRNYYKPHPGYYGIQKGYRYKKPFIGYKKPVNTYKKPVTAVAPYCRCITETTMLNLVVLDHSGTHLGNAAVWVGYEGQAKEVKTDKKGFLKVEVRGCEIGIIVWHNGKQEEYRILNLEKTKTKYKNVVIQVGKACNFLIYFSNSRIPEFIVRKLEYATLISYLIDINGGEQSTSGTAVVGEENSSPMCINVQDGGSVKLVVTSQSAELFSVLCLDEVEEEGLARVWLPFPISWSLANLSPQQDTFSLAVGSNVYDKVNPSRNLLESDPVIQYWNGNVVTQLPVIGLSSFFYVPGDVLERTNYLVYVTLFPRTIRELSGNMYIIDRWGVTQIVKNPPKNLSLTSRKWVLGCIIGGNLKNWREINKTLRPGPQPLPRNVKEFEKLCEEGILPPLR